MKILALTQPISSHEILNDLESIGHTIILNKTGKKYTQEEVNNLLVLQKPDIVIAGTENYGKKQLDSCPTLKMIARVGVGIDSIDLKECKKRNIIVTNVPSLHANPVAEFILAQILNGLRNISQSNKDMHENCWIKRPGKTLAEAQIGIFGFGAIGQALNEKLIALGTQNIKIYDVPQGLCAFSKEEIVCSSDVIVIAMPLNESTKNMFGRDLILLAKKEAIFINTSRGGIINELDLCHWLICNQHASAFIDVFEKEPYTTGPLSKLKNAILTPHVAGSTQSIRKEMELVALQSIENYTKSQKIINEVSYD